ncbi:hypothetical protein [Curtobacterium flaccumfaciens]|uniref:hypothetical protein n=1 Tax=Curtobacterium flaccumfaciens TaxID=2035 RepID=UPI000FFF2FC7|nr:hypothetical protein [Curtobacterium flaccumfaciens]MCS0644420.1 hypothetical protein [Curtobacterium flaccumfaciens pv. flaccumfaciens]MCS6525331.1 hypothetical protein [Curtobacterium flaccumfaciens pv. flaccumfaciens]MCS6530724.1 hypothetical protein [Curtobacterium flaccumfaciens pv. flaccumfaciens]NUU09691.1 hypothetical protein [Curtobacterium flaccumfaciens]RXF83879.1 hypothetical protein CffCFBP3418_10260 [Curtobacterium flaccumfaciens pv. flaccumfaciens]
MSDTTPTNGHGPDGSDRANRATAPTGWGAAPTPTSTSTLDAPAPKQQQQPYRADAGARNPGAWDATAPNGATPRYGAAAGAASPTDRRSTGPKPPWFWPLLAAIVGLAALLVGGGVGFAIGHAIGADRTQSTTQVPGTNRFPGNGTGQAPGYGSGSTDGTGS